MKNYDKREWLNRCLGDDLRVKSYPPDSLL